MDNTDADLVVRVQEAELVGDGGPGWFVVSGLPDPAAVSEKAASAGGIVSVDAAGRLHAMITARQLVNAAGRVDPLLGRTLEAHVEPTVASWAAPTRALSVRAADLDAASRPLVMGIVNATPDSFADGGSAYDPDDHPARAVAHARQLREAGADVVDVGGESTRPGAEPVDVDDELARVMPVVEKLASEMPVSIDTTKARVAREAVEVGAVLVNDVSAGRLDDDLLPTVADLDVGYVLMHMRGTPQTMQDDPTYGDVLSEVYEFLAEGLARCDEVGIDRDRVVVDPGIGFGKTAEHNHALLGAVRQFAGLGRPVMIGASRKSFLGAAGEVPVDERLPGSLAAATAAVLGGAAMVRVHDVAATRQAVDVARAIADAADG